MPELFLLQVTSGARGVVLLWCVILAVLFLLQTCGLDVGFHVSPIGEDRNWLYFLQRDAQEPAQKAFWQVDGRNPLAPWWYLLAKPLVEGTSYGIFIVRKLVDLFCGLSVYLVLRSLGGRVHERFALYAAALTLLWSFSLNPSQILWTMVLAMSVNLLAMATYVEFLNSDRRRFGLLVISLLLSSVATGTYALQAMACIGVFALAVFRTRPGTRLRIAILDSAPFAILLVLNLLIWSTTSAFDIKSIATGIPSDQRLTAFAKSVLYLLWHPSYREMLFRPWLLPAGTLIGFALASVGVAFVFVVCISKRSSPESAGEQSLRPQSLAIQTMIVVFVIAAPTVVLESGSQVFTPGTRTLMIQQATQPLLIASLIYFSSRAFRSRLEPLLFGLVFGAACMTLLGYNRAQVELTRSNERLVAGLKALVPAISKPTTFVVAGIPAGVSPHNSDLFIKTVYRSEDVNLRVLMPGRTADGSSYTDVVLGSKGVYAESSLGPPKYNIRNFAWLPYDSVIFVRFDGLTVTRISNISPVNFVGYRVRFEEGMKTCTPDRKTLISDGVKKWQQLSTTFSGEEVQLSSTSSGGYALMQHPISLSANDEYEITLEARSQDATASLYVDLYNGPTYDFAQQDSVVSNFSPAFRTFTATIPAGSSPPSSAFVRIVRAGASPVYVRKVQVARVCVGLSSLLPHATPDPGPRK